MRRRLSFLLASVALLALSLASPSAFASKGWVAQANPPQKADKSQQDVVIKGKDRVIIKRVTRHTFTGSSIGGKLYGPAGKTYVSHGNRVFNSLITYRSGFTKELWHTARNL
jgi:hypothetical protein